MTGFSWSKLGCHSKTTLYCLDNHSKLRFMSSKKSILGVYMA